MACGRGSVTTRGMGRTCHATQAGRVLCDTFAKEYSKLEHLVYPLKQTRSGPKIPAAELFGGRLYFGFGLLDAFFANQNLLAEGIQTADHVRNFKFSFQTYLV